MYSFAQIRGPLLEFRRTLVLEPSRHYTFEALNAFWPKRLPMPYFSSDIIWKQGLTSSFFLICFINCDLFKESLDENSTFYPKDPSSKYINGQGSFFGIVDWNQTDFEFLTCHGEQGASSFGDFPLIPLRTGNPFKQLLHDHDYFIATVVKLCTDLYSEYEKEHSLSQVAYAILKAMDERKTVLSKFYMLEVFIGELQSTASDNGEEANTERENAFINDIKDASAK